MNIKQLYWTALASTTSSIARWYEQHLLRKSSRNLQIFSLTAFFKCFATFRETLIKVLHTEHQKQLKNAANHCSYFTKSCNSPKMFNSKRQDEVIVSMNKSLPAKRELLFYNCAKTAWSKCLAISLEWLEFFCSSYNVTDIESLLHQSIIILMITGCFCVRVNTLQMLISRAQGFTFYFVNQESTYICI